MKKVWIQKKTVCKGLKLKFDDLPTQSIRDLQTKAFNLMETT
jgi:hypothetical protein